jgi:serine/threonine protein kinase
VLGLYDAFSNLKEGTVSLMIEYMDGGSLQDLVDISKEQVRG